MNVRKRTLAPGVIHEILANSRRRAVLKCIKEQTGTVAVSELARRIAERETKTSPPPRNIRKSVYNSLLQTHLPKLHHADVIEYDEHRKTVTVSESARDVHVYMELVTPYGITWSEYYRLLAVLALVSIIAVEVGVPVLSALDPVALAVVSLGAIALSTGYQLWSRRSLYLQTLLRGGA